MTMKLVWRDGDSAGREARLCLVMDAHRYACALTLCGTFLECLPEFLFVAILCHLVVDSW